MSGAVSAVLHSDRSPSAWPGPGGHRVRPRRPRPLLAETPREPNTVLGRRPRAHIPKPPLEASRLRLGSARARARLGLRRGVCAETHRAPTLRWESCRTPR
ncbi:unnamed protein product [Rangifer tarandus platyrhynchus]|uniref:Uncharacterized protein n=1 Tax=Rangifer tarandus platyrhynchus TaxID=3082113 RepID=A0ABN8Y120_RANTA|nr:unnamed protein product [Rangifer tarandus platyrhynchus]